MMNRKFKERLSLLRAVVVLALIGAACLTRPVTTSNPNLKTNFTSVIHSVAVDKLDLLFMIDNSASMGDKQVLLAQAVPDMINRLVSPNCVDTMGNTLGPSSGGGCTSGKLEFPPVHDMHLGIITSSLGGRGASTTCDPAATNPANPNLPAHNDDQAHLINRGGDMETPVAKAGSQNFLAWYPPVAGNSMPPVNAETNAATLIGDFTLMIQGVHEHGCGFEAQNEAWYRFLVQPDPFAGIQIDSMNQASLTGYDTVILSQRKAFLRPDSLLAIIVVTDENEEVANPLSVGREGWLYETAPWPGSPSGGGGPEGTVECQNNALDPNCTSCAFQSVNGNPARCPADPPNGQRGYLDPSNDNVNVRFFHQKQRFGIFSGYPVSRYIRGMTAATVPDRAHEVDNAGNYVGDQDQFANCINPIFATNLPGDASDTKALCSLARGPRTPDLVYYAVIGGVPHQLLQAMPGDPECPAGTNQTDCPQKNQLSEADWLAITGKDPENYDFTGADFHMIESENPRSQSSCQPGQVTDNCDAINGREWDTKKGDLQYACIFDLVDPRTNMPLQKDCMQMQYSGACDCNGGASQNTPLCQQAGGNHTSIQIKGKAYPSVREMVIAHQMANQPSGIQGIVSSMCPIHTTAASSTDPVYGYRPAVNAIINRLKNALSVQCLPQKLIRDPNTDATPCLVLVTMPKQGDKCDSSLGLMTPQDGGVLARFQAAQHAAWVAAGGSKSVLIDPNLLTICQLSELLPSTTNPPNPHDYDAAGDCSAVTKPGWCYVEGQQAGSCPQQLLFTAGAPPPGAQVSLQCIEQSNGALDGG